MGVAAVTGIDHVHMRRNVLGNQERRAAGRMAHHEQIRQVLGDDDLGEELLGLQL